MNAETIVIVGGGPAGLARSYREHGGKVPVSLIGEESLAAHDRDEDYEHGHELIATGQPLP